MRKLILITVLLWVVSASACTDDSECINEDCCGYLTQVDDTKRQNPITITSAVKVHFKDSFRVPHRWANTHVDLSIFCLRSGKNIVCNLGRRFRLLMHW